MPTDEITGLSIDESCGDFGIRIAADGTWYHFGAPIRRLPLARLFSTVLRREADGSYWLVTPVERGRIVVDDVPFIAVELTVTGAGRDQILEFRTNLDDRAEADENHPIRIATLDGTDEPRPYVMIRAGLEARMNRPVFYQLVELGTDETIDGQARFGVWSKGQFFPLDGSTPAT